MPIVPPLGLYAPRVMAMMGATARGHGVTSLSSAGASAGFHQPPPQGKLGTPLYATSGASFQPSDAAAGMVSPAGATGTPERVRRVLSNGPWSPSRSVESAARATLRGDDRQRTMRLVRDEVRAEQVEAAIERRQGNRALGRKGHGLIREVATEVVAHAVVEGGMSLL